MHKRIVSLIALSLLVSTPALAQGVGSKCEVSPFGISTQWLPGTVVGTTPGGDLKVKLDPREGYTEGEEYIVQKRWVRGSTAAPVQQQQPFGAQNQPPGNVGHGGGGLKIGDIVNASPFAIKGQWFPGKIIGFQNGMPVVRLTRPGMDRSEDHVIMPNWVKAAAGAIGNAVNGGMPQLPPGLNIPGANPGGLDTPANDVPPVAANPPGMQAPGNNGGPIKVGDRVKFSPGFLKDKSKWISGTVRATDGNGHYEVQTDPKDGLQNSVWQTVREEFIEKDNSAPPVADKPPGNFQTNPKPIPQQEVGVRPRTDCTDPTAMKRMLEDTLRYNYGLDYDQVDVSFESFRVGRSAEAHRKEMGAQEMFQADAAIKVRGIRKYQQAGRNYVKTVVYEYTKGSWLYWINAAGECVFGGVDKTGGKIIYDRTTEVAQSDFDRIHKIAYAKPISTCKCRRG